LCENGGFLVSSSIGETNKWGGWEVDNIHVFGKKKSQMKRKCEMVRCRNATASSFVAKVQGEVFARFHAIVVKRHSSNLWN
jgi:hypothetical protein